MSNINNTIKNFGVIKENFNTLLIDGILTKNKEKKDLFKKYINEINGNEILKTQFLVYTNIEKKIEPNQKKAEMFVNENINLFSKYKKKDILAANEKLSKVLPLIESDFQVPELYEHITNLILTEKKPSTIDTIVESTSKIVDHIVNNKENVVTHEINLPNSTVAAIMVQKYNDKYSDLDEHEKNILKVLIDSTDEEKKETYKDTIRECINLIDEKYKTSDLEEKNKLLMVKDKILSDSLEINENFFYKISKLVELRNTLKEN